MSQYDDMDIAILGMRADSNPVTRIESFVAQEDINFGYPVFGYEGDTEKCYAYHNDVAKLVYNIDFEASNSTIVTVNGVDTAPVVFTGTHDATMDLLITAITALAGVDANLGDISGDNRTIYIRTVGYNCVATSVTTLGTNQAVATITVQSDQVFIGVAQSSQKDVDSVDARYLAYQVVNVLSIGKIWAILKDETILANAVAYLETSGADAGKFSVDGSDINVKFRSNKTTNATTSDIMAQVEIDGQKKINTVIVWS